MTGNPIFVRYGMAHLAQCEDWEWTCTRCKATPGTYGFEWTAGAAADAGRRHLAEHHWAPIQDQINHAIGRMNTAMNSVGPFGPCDWPDCPICTTRNALQTAHNESREGC